MGDKYKLESMLQRQAAFQAEIDGIPANEEEAIAITKDLVLHLISECDELLREVSFKSHRRQMPMLVEDNILEEIVDIMKFLFAITTVWNFGPEELFSKFEQKSMVVEHRYQQEFPLFEIIREAEERGEASVVVLDIDGVLSDYPYDFFRWTLCHAAEQFSPGYMSDKYDAYEAFDGTLPLTEIKRMKHLWRTNGSEYKDATPIEGAAEFTHSLRAAGYKIVLVSARPVKRYGRIYADTMMWLQKHGFAYDALMWDERKEERLLREFAPHSIAMFIDDLERNVQSVRNAGIPAEVISRPYNQSSISFDRILRRLV